MAKIRVKDIAGKIGIPEQDLLFKLKSIGVRLEGEEGLIDTEIIQAILQGKSLPQSPSREVIMRDRDAAPAARRRPTPRRTPTGPARPRRRTVVSKADPKIKTIPTAERKREKTLTPEQIVAQEAAAEDAKRAAALEPATAEAGVTTEPPTAAEKVEAVRAKGTPSEAAAISETVAEAAEPAAQKKATEETESVPEPAGEVRGAITIAEGITVRALAEKLGIKAKDLIKELLMEGIFASVNHTLDPEAAEAIAKKLGYEALIVTFEEEVLLDYEASEPEDSERKEPRAPVVTVMGHVDHGKTSLLDAIRSAKVTESESGGITQHIAAYHVNLDDKRQIVFLDTPGHEAFTKMRARGAGVTDIVVLVVAADDGVMPQTVEAIQHARAAKVPIVVAINKIDRPNANPDRVKKGLSEQDLLVEDWGGETVAVPLSALQREGIDELLEMIMITSDMLELKADPTGPAQAAVVEARKETGLGIIGTLLVQAGTLRIGDPFVCGSTWGRVRTMTDDLGKKITEAGPSTAVELVGFGDLPEAGDTLQVVDKESRARDIAQLRQRERRQRELAPVPQKISLESLFSKLEEGETKELAVVIKADVQGSVEVLKETLGKLSTDKVKVRVIGAGVGGITTNDVLLASASNAIVVGFNVRPERNATELALHEEVDVRSYTVIYDLTDEITKAMTGLLDPTFKEVQQGRAEVREIFKVPRIGTVAGCHVVEGVIPRKSRVRLLRDSVVVFEGDLASLRRFKDDATEVRSGFDCGIGLQGFQDVKPGDMIEAFSHEAVAPTL